MYKARVFQVDWLRVFLIL